MEDRNEYGTSNHLHEKGTQKRSKRNIKRVKKEESLSSDELLDLAQGDRKSANVDYEIRHQEEKLDVVMEGSLIYRYSMDQIELEGLWSINNDITKEHFSYLFLKSKERLLCPINIHEIHNFDEESYKKFLDRDGENFLLKICSANIFEVILLPDQEILRTVLKFLNGEYHGFFMYYDKTIEDRFNLNFKIENNQVRINGMKLIILGEGTNSLGNFQLIGFLNFYNNKEEEITAKNDINSEVIKIGELKITRIYQTFNPTENYRVIKSFQHRKRKGYEYSDTSSMI